MLTRSIGLLALAALAACAPEETILPGERIAVRDTVPGALPSVAENRAVPVALPAATANAEWTQPGGNARHRIGHVALSPAPAPLWSAPVGQGEGRRSRITAEPVVTGGRIVAMDSNATVTATAADGRTLWTTSLVPPSDPRGERSGGGLAAAGNTVYATTGFGELVALDAATGAVRWRQRFDAPLAGAPAVDGDTVYAVARDASAWAIRAADGKVLWTLAGTPSVSGVIGGAAPAVGANLVVFPFSSGDLMATMRGGASLWTQPIVGERRGRAWSGIDDITSDPVIVGGTIYAGNQSGRTVAISAATGDLIWEAEEGSYGPVAVANDALFLVNDEARLVRLDARTGQTVWSVPMPFYTDEAEKRRSDIFVHYGPVLAGGRLVVASSDGLLRFFDPASGALTASVALPGGAAAPPAIAGQTLYVVTRDGQLRAYR